MGMAASQARFLGLTARKNNVEFEGQQINQQRTNLANQTANYYNDLLGMSVPTPPSVDNFTKTVYADYADGDRTNNTRSICFIANELLNSAEFEAIPDAFKEVVEDYASKYVK